MLAVKELTRHYEALCAQVPLRPIRTKAHYRQAIRALNELLDAGADLLGDPGVVLSEPLEVGGAKKVGPGVASMEDFEVTLFDDDRDERGSAGAACAGTLFVQLGVGRGYPGIEAGRE